MQSRQPGTKLARVQPRARGAAPAAEQTATRGLSDRFRAAVLVNHQGAGFSEAVQKASDTRLGLARAVPSCTISCWTELPAGAVIAACPVRS